MEKYKFLEVFIDNRKVGTLALDQKQLGAFEYDEEWINNGFSISPRSLPLKKKVFIPKADPFDGLYGVFADSLPDGWGRLLVDRMLVKEQINPASIGIIDRLAIVGNSGMGALTYRPVHTWNTPEAHLEYDRYAEECKKILQTEYSEDLDELFQLGGSSGGARPKIMTTIDDEEWIVKFPSSVDSDDIGLTEYRYNQCATKCGIEVPEHKLFPSAKCEDYFGTKRFDRKAGKRIHMISVSALLETSHRIPALDYNTLMQLTMALTNNYHEAEKMFRLMCFNVFAHNRDDHSNNFSFLYDEKLGWQLSPAYDLTYSNSLNGEHATCINGNGINPNIKDIYAVAEKIGLAKETYKRITEEVQTIVQDELGDILEKYKF